MITFLAQATNAVPKLVEVPVSRVLNAVEQWFTTNGLLFLVNFIAACAIFVVGRWCSSVAKSIIVRLLEARNIDPTVSRFAGNICSALILVLVIITALGQLGLPTTQFAALIAAAGLAIGLALQSNLSNFAAGFLLILFRPFKKGDYITGASVEGTVEEIQIFSTVLITGDNKRIIVPNSKLTGDNIVNYTAHDTRMIEIPITVGGQEDLAKVRRVMLAAVQEDPRVLKAPAIPVVVVKELLEGKVIMSLRMWAKTSQFWDVVFDTNEKIKAKFDAENIRGPVATRIVQWAGRK